MAEELKKMELLLYRGMEADLLLQWGTKEKCFSVKSEGTISENGDVTIMVCKILSRKHGKIRFIKDK